MTYKMSFRTRLDNKPRTPEAAVVEWADEHVKKMTVNFLEYADRDVYMKVDIALDDFEDAVSCGAELARIVCVKFLGEDSIPDESMLIVSTEV